QLQTDILFQSLDHTKKVDQRTLLATLSPVHEARYNSSYSETIKRHRCTPQTREGILADLKAWVNNPDSSKVYWLNGMAGTGKTTIMYSLCEWLEAQKLLGANFCCSHLSDACQKAHAIVPSIAFQLAGYSSAFQLSLCKVIEQEPHTITSNVETQFSKLVVQPMKAVQNNMPPGVVIVIDALDECENGSLVELLLQTLFKSASQLPVKFFVTSRPEPSIQRKMLGTNGYNPSVFHLHDIEQSLVQADIQIYLVDMFANINPPFINEEIFQLTKLAGKLFVYASTAAQYINPGVHGVNPHNCLKTMLKMAATPTTGVDAKKPYKHLDELYGNILTAAFNSELNEEEAHIMKLVLRTVICAKEPMAADTMASLLDITVKELNGCLGPLQSVIHVPEQKGLIAPLHASFPDYMLDDSRSGSSFSCNNAEHSEVLALKCFDLMKKGLQFNICRLESSFVFDRDVENLKEKIQDSISASLSYSCRYWLDHLMESNKGDIFYMKLLEFLGEHLLSWMEVLNLEQHFGGIPARLSQMVKWLGETNVSQTELDD
ncbi:hypothetical protein H0H87_006317, partial [Tephrocybe sp. NHM501043]